MNNRSLELLKQHIAILQSTVDTITRVTGSMADEVSDLELDGPAAEQPEESVSGLDVAVKAGLENQIAEARHVIEWLMAGGDPCKVCTNKCMMGAGECKPHWTGNDVGV